MRTLKTLAVALLAAVAVLCATAAQAQVLTSPPTAAEFTYADAAQAQLANFHVDFYRCTSVSAGACVGQASSAFNAGLDVPLSAVVTLSPPSSGNNKRILLNGAINGMMIGFPAGSPFVMVLTAIGDANQGVSGSAASNASNPFFASTSRPVAATGLVLR